MAVAAGGHYALGHIRLFPRLYRRIFGGDFCHPLYPYVGLFSGVRRQFLHHAGGLPFGDDAQCVYFYRRGSGHDPEYGRLSPALSAMFAILFSLGISVAWEIYEFTMDRLYGMSLQCSEPTSEIGLLDTMTDFIVAAAGGLAGMFLVAFYKNGKIGKNKKRL